MAKGFSFQDDDDDINLDVGSDSGLPAPKKSVTHRTPPSGPQAQRNVTRRPVTSRPNTPSEKATPAQPVRRPTTPAPVQRPVQSRTAPEPTRPTPEPTRPTPEPTRPVQARPAPVQARPAPVQRTTAPVQRTTAPSRPSISKPIQREEPAYREPQREEYPSYQLPAVDPYDPIDHDAIPAPASEEVEVHEEQVVPFDATPSVALPEEPEYVAPTPEFEPEAEPDKPVKIDKKATGKLKRARPEPRQKDKANKRKPVDSNSASSLSGGRGGALALRWTVVGLLGVLALTGGYKVLFPTAFPSPDQVTNVVRTNLGITQFPTGRADGFVTAFTKSYLTYSPDNQDARSAALRNYATDSILTKFSLVVGPNSPKQDITAGPFISGVDSKSDNAATFTVASEINGAEWVYIDVPVYYDKVTDSFAVSGSPSFVSAPPQALYPGTKDVRIEDTDASVEAKKNIETFLSSWAASDTDKIALSLTDDATNRARYGLRNTVVFSTITNLSVFEASKNVGTNPNERQAQVEVQWLVPGTEQTFFTQSYDMVILRNSNNTWTVKDIQGGVASSEGGGVPQTDNAATNSSTDTDEPSDSENAAPQAQPGD